MGKKFQIREYNPDTGVWIWLSGLYDSSEQGKQRMFELHIASKNCSYACEEVKKEKRGIKNVPG